MPRLRAIVHRVCGLFRRRTLETEMKEELRAHLGGLIERNVVAGMAPEEARFAALREFGSVAQIEERARDERRSAWGEQLIQDLRYAVRQLRKTPGYATISVIILGLGIGVSSAVFALFDAILLRTLPVHDPSQLF